MFTMQDSQILHFQLGPRSARDDIGCDSGFGERLGDHLIVFRPELQRGGPVIVAVHQQDGLRPHLHRMGCTPNGLLGGVAPGTSHDKRPAFGQLHHFFDNLVVFPPVHGWRLTSGARREHMSTTRNLKGHVFAEALQIQRPLLGKRGDQGGPASL